jgi:MSHA biogenesis protein MshM
MSLLYLEHFGLKKPPFKITPDLDFFFAGGRRGDVLTALLHVAQHEEGITTVVAEVGSGKTLISRLMISQLGRQVSTVYLPNPCFTRDEILSAIARDLGLNDLPTSTEARLALLNQELLRRHALGQRVLLVVDEAHAMPPESLEEVRLLSNLETGSHKLINIMLFGQPELDEVLADRRLRQVKDRVIHRFSLDFFPEAEARAYIDHRLRAAGWNGGALFSHKAMELLIRESGGRARRINLMADKALLAAYADGAATVEPTHVQAAISEFESQVVQPAARENRKKHMLWLALAAVAGSVLTVLLLQGAAMLTDWQHKGAVPTRVEDANPLTEQSDADTVPVAVTKPATSKPGTLEDYLAQTQRQLNNPDVKKYTVQLASLPRDANALQYLQRASEYQGFSLVFAQLTSYNDKKYIAVFFGDFATVVEANRAIKALPRELQTNRPIVRTWAKIRMDNTL